MHVLRLDAWGRQVDEHGNVVVNIPNNLSTLKVNINNNHDAAFQILKHFDPRIRIDKLKLLRPKKMTFHFVDQGKWSKQADIVKLRSRFGEGTSKDFKQKRIITKEKPKDPIPDVEWWDVPLLRSGTYGNITQGGLVEEVLGSEATQDPTRLEMEIRSAAVEREQAHVDMNIERKLTPAERRCAVISEGICVVVVEGGNKSIKRYQKLMLKTIKRGCCVKVRIRMKDADYSEETAELRLKMLPQGVTYAGVWSIQGFCQLTSSEEV
ncbi:RDM16-like protein isoform X2 [Tanacetum coccineum]